MSKVITDPAAELRAQAHALGEEWEALGETRRDVKRRMRTVLLDIEETPGFPLREAARILGISPPTMYRILEGNGRKAG